MKVRGEENIEKAPEIKEAEGGVPARAQIRYGLFWLFACCGSLAVRALCAAVCQEI